MRVLETFEMAPDKLPNTTTSELLGQHLAMLRSRKGWTQAKAALESGIHERTLKDIELGKGNPNLGTIEVLAVAYGVTLAAVFEPWRMGQEGAQQHVLCKKLEDILKHSVQGPAIKAIINAVHKQV